MPELLIGMELRSLQNLIRRYFEYSAHKEQVEKVTGTNGWIIGFLSENSEKDIYQKDLEEKFTITRSTASKVLNLMEQKRADRKAECRPRRQTQKNRSDAKGVGGQRTDERGRNESGRRSYERFYGH